MVSSEAEKNERKSAYSNKSDHSEDTSGGAQNWSTGVETFRNKESRGKCADHNSFNLQQLLSDFLQPQEVTALLTKKKELIGRERY